MRPKSSWLSALSLVSGSSWPGATFLEKTDSLFNFQQQLTDRGTDDSQMVSYSARRVWVCLPLLCHQCLLSLFWSLPSEQQTFQTEESSVASASLGYRQAKEGEIPSLPVEYQPLSVGLSGHRRVRLGTRVWSLHQNQEFIFLRKSENTEAPGWHHRLSGCVVFVFDQAQSSVLKTEQSEVNTSLGTMVRLQLVVNSAPMTPGASQKTVMW